MLELETRSFSRMMVHAGVGYFLEACKSYADAFSLRTAIPVAEQAIREANRSAQEAAAEFHDTPLNGNDPTAG